MRPEATTDRGRGASKRRDRVDLEAELARLEVLDGEGLEAEWQDRFGASPPPALPMRLLLLALAHDLQTRALGGLSPAVVRRLGQRDAAGAKGRGVAPTSIRLKPGATLLRDWGGRTWRVEVEAEGSFVFESQRWRSLSAIARAITGTSRNGPAFFGLRGDGDGAA
jgi:hypothetical protein